MGQRLARAKTKIREAGLRFEEPDPDTLTDRLEAVLRAIYVAYGTAWDIHAGAEKRRGLTDEAIYLARLIVDLCPGEPEPKGLLALMLYCEARSAARRVDGAFIPLAEQDTKLWSRVHIAAAEELLTAAAAAGTFGRFQAEAAIQSVHVTGSLNGKVQTEALIILYDLLAAKAPTIGVQVARAAAYGDARSPAAGIALLDQIDPDHIQSYQPYWACRAHLLQQAGRPNDAAPAFDRAIGLSSDPALREYLIRKKQGVSGNGLG
jgi:RNA polymerase sigma-70 factor (ECF subfamily)